MPVDPGVVDAYTTMLDRELDQRQTELDQLAGEIAIAKLEQRALKNLTADDAATLDAAGITGRRDRAALTARQGELVLEVNAIEALLALAKGAA